MTPDGKRIWGYCRASTRKQTESPETQKEIIKAYCKMNGLGKVDQFYVDAATSGHKPLVDRDAGAMLMSRIRPGDVLVVAKLDRAFRRLVDACQVMEQLERLKCSLHVCNMNGCSIDLTSPMGRMVIHILAAFAEMERRMIGERIRDGLAHARKKGNKWANWPGYGFRWATVIDEDGAPVLRKTRHDGERAVMREIVGWRSQDPPLSFYQIADILGCRGELTKDGVPWETVRVMRAFKAELRLMKEERLQAQ